MEDKIIKDKSNLTIKDNYDVFNRETSFNISNKGQKICRAVQMVLSETNEKDFLVESLQSKIKKIIENVVLVEAVFVNSNSDLSIRELKIIHRSLFSDVRAVEEFLVLGVFSGIFYESNVEKIRIAIKIFLNILIDFVDKVEENYVSRGLKNKRLNLREGDTFSPSLSTRSKMDDFIEEIIAEKKEDRFLEKVSKEPSYIKDTKRQDIVLGGVNLSYSENEKLNSTESQGILASKTLEIKKRRQDIQDLLKIEGTLNSLQVAEHFKGCSEKTIQRDLNFLIKKGLVKREGKKRWSVYSRVDTK